MPTLIRQTALLIFINVILLVAMAAAATALVVSARGLRFDFYPHYVGGRIVWQGQNPYAREVTDQIQLGMFGGLLPEDADQQNMAYPAYASIMLAPVLWLPAHSAIALWMAVQFCAILWTPVIWLYILQWRPMPLLAAALLLGLVFVFRYPMDLFVLGQFSGTVLLAISAGFLLLLARFDVLAGVVFSLATIPPTIGAPLALSILVAYGLRGRWRGLMAFAVTMTLLIFMSLALVGNWIPDYLGIVQAYSEYAPLAWAPSVIEWLPLRVIFIVGLMKLSGWILWRFWQTKDETYDKAVDLVITALIVSLLLLPQTGKYYLVLLIPPVLACLHRTGTQDNLPVAWMVRLSCLLVIVSPWLYDRATEDNLQLLLVPLHVLVTWCTVNYNRWRAAMTVSLRFRA